MARQGQDVSYSCQNLKMICDATRSFLTALPHTAVTIPYVLTRLHHITSSFSHSDFCSALIRFFFCSSSPIDQPLPLFSTAWMGSYIEYHSYWLWPLTHLLCLSKEDQDGIRIPNATSYIYITKSYQEFEASIRKTWYWRISMLYIYYLNVKRGLRKTLLKKARALLPTEK